MSVEVGQFLSDTLARLPADHPDRELLEGLKQTVEAFTGRDAAPAPAAPETETMPASETRTASEDLSKPEQERVHLHGRLGYPPTFRTTPNAVLVGSFPLAVRGETDPDQTTWWKVFVFRTRAEKLREQQLSKGQAVEVIGYGYDHTLTRRDGTTSTERRVNAVAVKAR